MPRCPKTELTLTIMGRLPACSNGTALRINSAEAVARRAVKAIRRGRHEIILTPGGKLLVWFDRLCPPLVNRLVARFG
jgi:short-subunit dehydrogenase